MTDTTTGITSPTPPAAVPINELGVIEKDVKTAWTFGVSHLVLIVCVLIALVGAIYFWDSKAADRADARANLAQALSDQKDKDNAALQKSNIDQQAQFVRQNAALQSAVSSLASAVAKRDATFQTHAAAIPTLAPPALAIEWGKAASEPTPVVDTSGNALVPLPLAQKSVIALELVPVLQQDKRDLQSASGKDAQIISNDSAALGKEQAAHVSDQAACTADRNALKADLSQVKADARVSKIHWFLYGVGAGIGFTVAFVLR
jgi:hypothetical protein